MDEFTLEKDKLKNTINIINEELIKETNDLDNLFKDFAGNNRDVLWDIAKISKIHVSNLERAKDKPYFARIDFLYDDTGKTNTVYIGRNGIMKNGDIVVTDWRAPISSLYYDGEVGKCEYEAPEGIISGEMQLKRQFEIENGKLLNYFDVDLVNSDILLQKYLNSNNDSRLKSIVSTIQKEQNDAIRKKIGENIIVQGVAGSGKTTVALHRVAYLVYNYLKSIKQNQYLVIGPNPVFIKYIQSVLPDLDVSGVEQCTFEEFASKYIKEDLNLTSSEKKANANIIGKITNDIDKFKCSMKYKNMLDKFIQIYLYSLTSNDLKIGDFVIMTKGEIKEIFDSTENMYVNNNLKSRINNTIEKIVKKNRG